MSAGCPECGFDGGDLIKLEARAFEAGWEQAAMLIIKLGEEGMFIHNHNDPSRNRKTCPACYIRRMAKLIKAKERLGV